MPNCLQNHSGNINKSGLIVDQKAAEKLAKKAKSDIEDAKKALERLQICGYLIQKTYPFLLQYPDTYYTLKSATFVLTTMHI